MAKSGSHTRTAPLTDKEAQRLLAALRAGKSLRAICAGMVGKRYVAGEKIAPDYQSFHNYCKAQPEYARQASELLAANRGGYRRQGAVPASCWPRTLDHTRNAKRNYNAGFAMDSNARHRGEHGEWNGARACLQLR
jgi:hypothetical protein